MLLEASITYNSAHSGRMASTARARLDSSTDSYRRPPEGWESAVAKLARERAAELVKLAEELRPGSHYPLVVGRIVPWFGKAIREGNWTILEVHNPERAHEDEGFPGDGVDVLVVPVSAGRLSRYRDAVRGVLQAL